MARKSVSRRKTRELLVQALYSWLISGSNILDIETHTYVENDMSNIDREFFKELLYAIPKQRSELESSYTPFLDRALDDLDPVSRAILALSCYELMHRIDVPYRVAINEGVNLAKTFGPTDAYKFINGILDQVAVVLRPDEVRSAGR